MDFSSYTDMTPLSVGSRTTVYRALDEHAGHPVIVKVLRPENDTPEAAARLRFEYEMASKVVHPCVARPLRLVDEGGQLGIAFEDIGGTSLRLQMGQHPLSVRDCLTIAEQVAQALVSLHEAGIVHRDVTWHNIVHNRATGRAQLIDLGIASRLSRERASLEAVAAFEGTLAFVSPEQTGRLNRAVDARSDLYSLGCTLYTLLTGQVPFAGQDTLELVHAILAKVPPAPRALEPSIPAMLSDLVMCLLAKSPEDRYQSAAGLLADLRTLQTQLEQGTVPAPFPLRTQDHDETFKLPEKLYGREAETAALARAFARMTQDGDNLWVLITGDSGEGKSALVGELQRGIVQHRALYGAGKFDAFGRAVPYSAFNEAFTGLLRQVLRGEGQRVAEIRERLTGALGNASGVLVSVLPAFELLLGKAGPFHPLGPKESENRFLVLFQDAMRVMATRQHPLTLFIDDLQWADRPSLELIRILATPSLTPHVLLVGAYRRKEVDGNHPLTGLITELQASGARIDTISLTPLQPRDIEAFVADALLCTLEEARPLAALLADKTGGNAFFVGEFLRRLYQTGKLHYVRDLRRWDWDLAQIRTAGITDNVVALMLQRMQEMPTETQLALSYAATMGSIFDASLLAQAMGVTPHVAGQHLWPAARSGIVEPLDEAYKYDAGTAARYRFAHDKIRQAASELTSSAEHLRMRHTLGILLLRVLSPEALATQVFEVASHLQATVALLAPEEAAAAQQLLLQAGRRAKAANACQAALDYLLAAEKLMPANAWDNDYANFHALQLDLAECEDLIGNTPSAKQRMDVILQHCKDPVAMLHVRQRSMALMASQNQLQRVLETGLVALKQVGVKLPEHPTVLHIVAATLQVGRARRGRSIAKLAEVPSLQNPMQEGVLSILAAMEEPAFQINSNLFILVAQRIAAISLAHGLSRYAPYSIAAYGIVLASALNKPQEAAECGALTQQLIERYGTDCRPGATLMAVAGLLSHYDAPLSTAIGRAEAAYRTGVETGELDAAFRSACMVVAFQLQNGHNLASVQSRANDFAKTFALRAELIGREVLLEYRQASRALLGATQGPTSFADADYDEAEHVRVMRGMQAQAPLADYFSLKMQVAYVMGELSAAEQFGTEQAGIEELLRGMPLLQQYYFFLALTTSELLLRRPRERRAERQRCLRRTRRKLAWWASAAPSNFAHDLEVIDAQRAQLAGNLRGAAGLYEAALGGYEAGSHLSKLAVTQELYARMNQRQLLMHAAEAAMRDAHATYERWGAAPKVLALEEEFPQWLKRDTYRERGTHTQTGRTGTQSTTGASAVSAEDFRAVLGALGALAEETSTERLTQALLRNLITYAGAERAMILVPRDQDLVRVNEVRSSDPDGAPPPPTELATALSAPLSVLRYAQRTRETVIVDDASADKEYAHHDYFSVHKVKAALCMPVHHKGQLKAILYAENALVGYAFTRARVDTCRMLATQAAVCWENATLHAQLDQQVQARTQEMRQTQERLVRVEKDATEAQMAGGFAHEMRNTLSAAQNALGAAMGDNVDGPGLDAQLRQLLDDVSHVLTHPQAVSEQEAQQLRNTLGDMASTLSDIMNLTHESVVRALEVTTMIMEYSRLGLTRRGTDAVDVREVVGRIAEEARAEMTAAHVALTTQLEATSTFYGTEAHFYSVIRNLVNNARDALTACHDDRERHIEVHLLREGALLKLRVRDNADGMPEPVQRRIFEPFFSTKPETGMGLGLSMVRKLVELYSGTIEVKSTVGQGTTFTVTYPTAE